MVSWGDVGVSVAFVSGMFAMWRWPRHVQPIAALTLLAVVTYLVCRGILRGIP
jgi:hypothetical protein